MNTTYEAQQQRHHKAIYLTVGGLLLAGVIVLAAVGFSGGKSAAGNSMSGMSMTSSAAGTGNAVATNTVDIKNFAFSPAAVTVTAGSTVTWTNDDSVQHDITFNTGGIKSNVLNHGDTFSHTFTTAGTYHYICSIHPFMHGTVVVTTSGSQNASAHNGTGY